MRYKTVYAWCVSRNSRSRYFLLVFSARCTIVHSAVGLLGLHDVRPSVCPSIHLSVTLVDCDHIGWKSWKLISRRISATPSLFGPQTPSSPSIYSHANMGKFVETRGGVEKSGVLKHESGNRQYLLSLKRVQIEEKLLAYVMLWLIN